MSDDQRISYPKIIGPLVKDQRISNTKFIGSIKDMIKDQISRDL